MIFEIFYEVVRNFMKLSEIRYKSFREYIIFQGQNIDLKLKSLIEGTDEKHFVCKIVDFDPEKGLTVEKLDNKQTYLVPKDKILRAQLHIDDI